jgi:hypothetical protein
MMYRMYERLMGNAQAAHRRPRLIRHGQAPLEAAKSGESPGACEVVITIAL